VKKILSIITINLNNYEGLVKTVDSVLRQIDDRIEFIVVDGDSTDGSKEFILKESLNIHKWVSEKDAGIYDAMNKGITLAEGDYCLFLNSGDYFDSSGVINRVLPYCVQRHDIVVFSLTKGGGGVWELPHDLDLCYFLNSTLPHQSTFVKKSLLDKYRFDSNLKIVSDWKFFLEVYKFELNVNSVIVDEAIVFFDLSGISSDKSNEELIRMERRYVLDSTLGRGVENQLLKKKMIESKLENYHLNYLMILGDVNWVVYLINFLLVISYRFQRLINHTRRYIINQKYM
jgi:glycosyltransferase involved in cell wall biosynthesis